MNTLINSNAKFMESVRLEAEALGVPEEWIFQYRIEDQVRISAFRITKMNEVGEVQVPKTNLAYRLASPCSATNRKKG